jgi:hypothetical protein
MAQSFWTIPGTSPTGVPLQLLKQQAEDLTIRTDGVLRGEVETTSHSETIYIAMFIRVPNLDGYQIKILEYQQPLTMYPRILVFNLTDKSAQIDNFNDFLLYFRNYLGSNEMTKVIGLLLAQAQA